jgi:hypothetical protein
MGQSVFTGMPFEQGYVKDGLDESSVEGVADTPYAIPDFTPKRVTGTLRLVRSLRRLATGNLQGEGSFSKSGICKGARSAAACTMILLSVRMR